MIRFLSATAFVIGMSVVTGCVSRETLRASFRQDLDQCVGKIFMEPESWGCRWSDTIAKRHVSPATDEYDIAMDHLGKCRWTYAVDRASGSVTSWRYASGEEDCYVRIDWLGPW